MEKNAYNVIAHSQNSLMESVITAKPPLLYKLNKKYRSFIFMMVHKVNNMDNLILDQFLLNKRRV